MECICYRFNFEDLMVSIVGFDSGKFSFTGDVAIEIRCAYLSFHWGKDGKHFTLVKSIPDFQYGLLYILYKCITFIFEILQTRHNQQLKSRQNCSILRLTINLITKYSDKTLTKQNQMWTPLCCEYEETSLIALLSVYFAPFLFVCLYSFSLLEGWGGDSHISI